MSTPLPRSGLLPHLGTLRFSGPDALNFLQGQLSHDTRRLGEGRTLLAAYSSPQGRVLAVLRLLPHSSGVIAILPRELLAATRDALQKYVMRAKVKIDDASASLAVAGVHGQQALHELGLPAGGLDCQEADQVTLAAVNGDAHRFWVLADFERVAALGLTMGSDSGEIDRDWRRADIQAGLPQIYQATREVFVAQMLNLDLIDGISFAKGCYTGQEIIARTQHRGRIKRRMFRLLLPQGHFAIGQAIRLEDGRAGRVVELESAAGDGEALAVLHEHSDSAEGDSSSAVIAGAQLLPLPYAIP